ncbi:MAG TPA: DUF3857 domain-containing protein [bacterium]|nr:DUF3857 domain-containing protein [bacterium]HPP09085.1 DUF3857 domain-containing protein [bacterium]
MWRHQEYALFLILIAFLCGCAHVSQSTLGPPELNNHNQKIFSDKGSVYLLDEADVQVFTSGASITTIHQKILITGEKGKQHGTLQIPFDAERQKVEILKATTITPENKTFAVRKSDIRIITPAELSSYSVLYPGIRVCTITFPSVNIDCIIEYSYRITTKESRMPGEFWDGFFFQSTEPFLVSRYKITVPANKELYIYPFSVELKSKTKDRRFLIYEWEKTNMPAITPERMMPPVEEVVPKILVTTIKDWDKIGKWFLSLAKDSTIPDSVVKSIAAEITKNAQNDEEKIKAIYHFICKNIRYIGLELGIHGFKPHAAKDVIKLGYGDCKDKAALMVAMLKSVGIQSYIALVNTERHIEKNVPFPGQFNHAIVAVAGKHQFLLLDPTSEVIPYPELPPGDQNKTVLIPTENETILMKSYAAEPEENKKEREINVLMDSNGDITANVVALPSGIFAAGLRSSFRYLSGEEMKREISRSINSLVPNSTLKDFTITGIESLDMQVKQTYSFISKKYAVPIQEKLLFKPGLLERIENTELISLDKRNFPIRFPYRSMNKNTIVFNLPLGYEIDAYPEDVRIENKFGMYSLNFDIKHNKLTYQRIMSLNTLEISVAEYNDFKDFYQQVSYHDSLPVILKKTH